MMKYKTKTIFVEAIQLTKEMILDQTLLPKNVKVYNPVGNSHYFILSGQSRAHIVGDYYAIIEDEPVLICKFDFELRFEPMGG